MKMRKVAILFVLVTVLCLAGCGKKTPAEEPAATPTATPAGTTPTTGPEGTPTPEVTDGPDIPEGTPVERLVTALHNAFADGNVTVTSTTTVTSGTETETRGKSVRFVTQEDGEMVYIDETFSDGGKQHEFIFLQEHGGVHMWEWWENTKMMYEFQPVGEEDASYMYPIICALREPGDKAFQLFMKMMADIFPDIPKKAISGASLLEALAPYSTEEFLEKTLGYHQTEDGADVYLIRKELIAGLVQSMATDFKGMAYYLGSNNVNELADLSDIEVTIAYANGCVDTISAKFASVSEGAKAEWKLAFTNVGATVINIPTKKAEEFEKRKFNSMGEEPSNRVGWLKQYEQDALDGRVDKDVETINTLLNFYRQMLADPATNAAVKEIIGKEEYTIYYSEGSNYDKSGIELLDKQLKEKFGTQKLEMVSVMWTPLNLHVILWFSSTDNAVGVYWEMY